MRFYRFDFRVVNIIKNLENRLLQATYNNLLANNLDDLDPLQSNGGPFTAWCALLQMFHADCQTMAITVGDGKAPTKRMKHMVNGASWNEKI